MEFSPLETSLITVVFSVACGLVVKHRSVSRAECQRQHVRQDEKFNILFRMVRALVVHSSIPEEEKVRILNQRGDD
jgi:hypothetical protein